MWIVPLAVAEQPSRSDRIQAQGDVDRGQAADPTTITVPGHQAEELLRIAGFDGREQPPVCSGRLPKLAVRDAVRVAKLRTDMGQVGAGHHDRPTPDGADRVAEKREEPLHLRLPGWRPSVGNQPMHGPAQDRNDSNGGRRRRHMPEKHRLQLDRMLPPVSELVLKIPPCPTRYEPVEGRPAQSGDFVLLDIASQPEGGKPDRSQDTLLELGSQANPPELNAALAGMSTGETKTVQVAYGEKHPAPALAGRRVQHTVTLKAIKRKILPEIDDELAKDFGDFSGLGELREKLRATLLEADRRKIDREEKNALLAALVQKADFEVPETLVEHHMSARTEGVARTLAFQGVDPSEVGVDWKEYRESQREVSVRAARADILIDEIARREGLDATEAEVEAQIAGLAERLKKSREAMRAHMEKEGELNTLRARIREGKTLDLLRANARLTLE